MPQQGRLALAPVADRSLAADAIAVLDANRLGDATRPSPLLYPHQWSWDSAFIAMAYAHVDQGRGERELRALFAGQWANGMLPHIVFSPDSTPYFPGPEVWQTHESSDAPTQRRTSGIVQPPVHATAARAIHRHATDHDAAQVFVAEMVPALSAWHDYLHRTRTRGGGLVEIWHPWESGMDNSPLWDDALARMDMAAGDIPDYQRIDLTLAPASERPTNAEYDRYAYLVSVFRCHRYDPSAVRDATPFAIQDVLFNAILVQADRDLAALVTVLGHDPTPLHDRADRTARALDAQLWDDTHAMYLDRDMRTGALIPVRTPAGWSPLYAGVPSADRASRIVSEVMKMGVEMGEGLAVPSLSPDDPRFQPTLYWRGPIWPVINWLLWRGLLQYGYHDEAARVRTALLGLARQGGFFEHYDPTSAAGHGGEQFAWTAALILDLLYSNPDDT